MRFAVFLACILYGYAFVLHHRHATSPRDALQRNELIFSSPSSITEYSPIQNEKDDESFTDKLLDRLRRNDTSPIVVEGYVTSKRTIGKHLAFLDFQVNHGGNDDINDETNLCQALLRKDVYNGGFHEGYRRCLLKGTKFRLKGVAAPTRIPGNVVLMLDSMEILGLPRQAQHIQIILQHAVDGCIPFGEIVRACSAANSRDESLKIEDRLLSIIKNEQRTENDEDSRDGNDTIVAMAQQKAISKTLKLLAKEILRALPGDPQYPVAADQKVLSKEGNFIVPAAPKEWQAAPDQDLMKDYYDLTTTSRVKDTLAELMGMVNSNDHKSAKVSITGWVQNRRRFEGNITMVYVVDNLNQSNDVLRRLPCLVHPDIFIGNGKHSAEIYQNLIGGGAKVQFEGKVILNNNDDDDDEDKSMSPFLLWIEKIRLLRSSSRSINTRHLLDLLYEKRFDPQEASDALLISREEAKELSMESDATQRQWKANLLAVELQKEASAENNSMRRVDPVLLQVMENYKHLSEIYPVVATGIDEGNSEEDENLINDSNVSNGLTLDSRKRKSVVMGMPGSKWQIKKKPQLEWMGRQIRRVLESHPDFRKRKLTILDIGGGKGALANYLGEKMGEHVRIHVVDISQGAVSNGRKKAERLDLPVDFQFADASNSNLLDAVDADVVVALHACGHLSDVALNHAVHRKAGFVIVPCCFNSNPHLMIPSSDMDGEVSLTSVPDWLDLPVGDWSALKLLAEVQDNIPLASEAIGILCAIRAQAAKHKSPEGRSIEIKSFPIQYSTRNTVLVGKCS